MREHGFGLDLHRMEQRQKQQGLGLAIAIAQLIGLRGRLRYIVAAIHADRQIANFVLHQLQRTLRATERGRVSHKDPCDFVGKRSCRRNRAVRRIKRRKGLRYVCPVCKGRQLHKRRTFVALRRIGRHFGLLGDGQRKAELGIVAFAHRFGDDVACQQLPGRWGLDRPRNADLSLADPERCGWQGHHALRVAAERLVARSRGRAQAQEIADPQPFDRKRCRQNACQFALLEGLFAPEHRKTLSFSQQIDRLASAQDRQFMNHQVALVGRPGDGDVRHLPKQFGRRYPR